MTHNETQGAIFFGGVLILLLYVNAYNRRETRGYGLLRFAATWALYGFGCMSDKLMRLNKPMAHIFFEPYQKCMCWSCHIQEDEHGPWKKPNFKRPGGGIP